MIAFNQAMIAKQGWRILTSPNSLMCRVLKACYFPTSSFFKCTLGRNPSFVWRSIMWGRECLLKGARWRIGDGRNVLIYEDPWCPGNQTFKILSPRSLPELTTAASLISHPGQWNTSLVKGSFSPDEADAILSIPLPSRPRTDDIIWHFSSNGCFSVRSAYRTALQQLNGNHPSSSKGPDPIWKSIWKLDLPLKIRIFIWKMCRDILPTMCLLTARRIANSVICQNCKKFPENISHALWGCKNRFAIWSSSPLLKAIKAFGKQHSLEVCSKIFSSWNPDEGRIFLVASWLAWRQRNLSLFESGTTQLMDVWLRAVQFVNSFDEANSNANPSPLDCPSPKFWSFPPENTWKINTDAAIDEKRNRIGLGLVIRDWKGSIISAKAISRTPAMDVSISEAKALLEGLLLAKTLLAHSVVLESDSLHVVNLCNGSSSSRSDISNIIHDIREESDCSIVRSISHIPREGNSVAHGIAKWALDHTGSTIWSSCFPLWLINLAKSDVSRCNVSF